MRPGSIRAGVCLLLAACGPAAGAPFDALPGPVSGSLNDWAGIERHAGGGAGISIAAGRPAAIEQLGWGHLLAGGRLLRLRVRLEAFYFGLEDLYRESAAGLWVGAGGIEVGLRRWGIEWEGEGKEYGWSLSGSLQRRIGRLTLCAAAQDLPLAERVAGPLLRFGGNGTIRLSPAVHLGVLAHRAADGAAGGAGEIAWAPLAGVAIRQRISLPGRQAQTGLEVGSGAGSVAFWWEPTERLGSRIGLLLNVDRPGSAE